jgi:Ca2+ transporting ATPase
MEQAHIKSVEEVCAYFGVDEEAGLNDEQIKKNREKYGPNGKFFHLTFIS